MFPTASSKNTARHRVAVTVIVVKKWIVDHPAIVPFQATVHVRGHNSEGSHLQGAFWPSLCLGTIHGDRDALDVREENIFRYVFYIISSLQKY
jgi:hypothetical protein